MKINNQFLLAKYAAPLCRVMTIIPRQVICQSGRLGQDADVSEGSAGDDWFD